MKQSNQATSIANGLLVPYNFFLSTMTVILRLVAIFLATELLVCLAYWKDKKEGVGRPRHKSEQLGLVDAEDVMECELVRKPKLVDE
jgi:hypothetical protein